MSDETVSSQSVAIPREKFSLFGDLVHMAKTAELIKAISDGMESHQGVTIGDQLHPFKYSVAKSLRNVSTHHSTCILTKRDSTVGLGFMTPEMREASKNTVVAPEDGATLAVSDVNPVATVVDERLDPLCDESFAEVLDNAAEDFWTTGVGYVEVVRSGGRISGLWPLPTEDVVVHVEDAQYNYHYKILATSDGRGERRFCRKGDKERFLNTSFGEPYRDDPDSLSEVIRFRQPSALNRWYSVPDWIPAISSIELLQALTQYKYDFFMNRGVPEFMLFITGGLLNDEQWKEVKDSLQRHVGLGNSHKSFALNVGNPELKIQLEKMMADKSSEEEFLKTKESLDQAIVSAHRVPPLLANILIPGKLGALNELPNSLMAFQTLVIGPAQRIFQRVLIQAFVEEEQFGFKKEDFTFRRVTDIIDPATMDTVGRMRQTVPEAQAEGRNLSAGVRD